MTQRTAHTVWHCTKRYRDHYCSWLYHQTLGTLQEPYCDELSEEQVLNIEAQLLDRKTLPQVSTSAPTRILDDAPSFQPHAVPTTLHTADPWQATLHHISQLLPDPDRAAVIVANTTLLDVSDDVITVRVHQPRHLQWLTDPVHQSIANTAATQARSQPTTVRFIT